MPSVYPHYKRTKTATNLLSWWTVCKYSTSILYFPGKTFENVNWLFSSVNLIVLSLLLLPSLTRMMEIDELHFSLHTICPWIFTCAWKFNDSTSKNAAENLRRLKGAKLLKWSRLHVGEALIEN